MEDHKYIVMKRSQYEMFLKKIPVNQLGLFKDEQEYGFERMFLEDAVVIRKQDIAASNGLAMYANTLQTIIDTLRLMGPTQRIRQQIRGLEDIRDYFFSCATEASIGKKKLPD